MHITTAMETSPKNDVALALIVQGPRNFQSFKSMRLLGVRTSTKFKVNISILDSLVTHSESSSKRTLLTEAINLQRSLTDESIEDFPVPTLFHHAVTWWSVCIVKDGCLYYRNI